MEQKTRVHAPDDRQEIIITREFDLPLSLLFKAYSEADLVAQWMGNKVLKMESKPHGCYQFETTDDQGNVLFRANGVIHTYLPNQQIIRTFEMENTPFPVQLEFLDFESISEEQSKLKILIIFKSRADRDAMLKLPFVYGINMAHDRLQQIINQLK